MSDRGTRKRPSSRVVAALAVALLAPLLLACGGGEGEPDGGGGQADFLAQADAICVETAESFIELTRDPVTSPAEAREREAEIIELREEESERLAELEPPPELESEFEAALAANEELTALNEELSDAFAENDQASVRTLWEEFDRAEDRVDATAAEVGLEACAGQMPDEEAVEAASTAREFLTSTDPAICSELMTEKFIAEAHGGEIEDCEREIEQRDPPSEVTTSEVSGTGVSATVDAQRNGETVDMFLIKEEDGWKVDVANVRP